MADDEPAPAALPYEEQSRNSYADLFLTSADMMEDPHSVDLTGTCPRCHHVMTFLISDFAAQRHWFQFRVGRPGDAADAVTEPMLCTCEEEHPGRPANGIGCGAFWNVQTRR